MTAHLPTVLVTGGAQRLGAVLCAAFARAGWRVVCHYQSSHVQALDLQQRLRGQGAWVELVQADLADAAARAAMMQHIATQWGPLQALVNNASLFAPDTGLDFAEAQAVQQLGINLLAPLDLARKLAQQQAGDAPPASACAIHVLDQKVYNLNPDYFSYTVSKLALERAAELRVERGQFILLREPFAVGRVGDHDSKLIVIARGRVDFQKIAGTQLDRRQ